MQIINIKRFIGLAMLFVLTGLVSQANASTNQQTCGNLQVPAGFEVSFHAYAIGVQIYRWNGSAWDFVAPVAELFADRNHHGQIGIHYGGPTWESNSGSKVVARRLQDCTPDQSAIPWLLLESVSTTGPGVFKRTAFIQRVNTIGGLRPTTPGPGIGFEARVPYKAKYYFFSPQN